MIKQPLSRAYQAFLLFLISSLLLGLASCQTAPEKEKTKKRILVVLAHPDDETAFASVLAKYAREGHAVQLVIAVDARNDTRFIKVGPDTLGRIKKANTVCSCEKLGILSPINLGLETIDRKYGPRDGVRAAVEASRFIRDTVKKIIESNPPDMIMTFGPDGEYGHPEHIIVSSVLTELLLREAWVDKYPLYYFQWLRSQEEGGDGWVRYMDDAYINLTETFLPEDEERAFQSIRCYESGFSQEEMNELIGLEKKRKNEMYFRRFAVSSEKKSAP